ncbi:hypothetical protein BC941DRAFT_499290 [Chlamydoabsidia padenii]|nr:hypothetical protein BC941DRAFT_499290 [Chlamydoabsidia padenii]
MTLAYLKTTSSGFYDLLVQTPLAERLNWSYTWHLFTDHLAHFGDIDWSSCLQELVSNCTLFRESYRHVDPFSEALVFVGAISVIHYLVSVASNNYSQVDKAWSILPIVYAWHFFYNDYLNRDTIHPRLLLAAVLITLWGFRLTWNFARKGGYEWKGQDYRYPYIKSKIGPVAMGVLNLTVIAPFQDALLLMMVSPLYMTNLTFMGDADVSLNKIDLLATVLFTFFLGIEMTADEQQYRFQTEKYCLFKHKLQLSGDYKRGFLTNGLFGISRHANFFSEMGIWWSIYLFSVSSTGDWLNWTIIGPFTLTLLFQGSTWLTELISSEKYPEYKLYQQSVNRFIPWYSKWSAHAKDE